MTGQMVALAPMIFDTSKLTGWVMESVVPLLLLWIGITIILHARKGQLREVAGITAGTVAGIFVMVGAGVFVAFGQKIADLVTK